MIGVEGDGKGSALPLVLMGRPMRTTEDDRFAFAHLEFSGLDECLALGGNALQQFACRFVRRILRHKFAMNREVKNLLVETFCSLCPPIRQLERDICVRDKRGHPALRSLRLRVR